MPRRSKSYASGFLDANHLRLLKRYFVLSCLFQLLFVIKTCANDCDVKINARETTESKMTEVFDLKVDKTTRWTLAEDSLVEVPSALSMSQHLRVHILNANY